MEKIVRKTGRKKDSPATTEPGCKLLLELYLVTQVIFLEFVKTCILSQ